MKEKLAPWKPLTLNTPAVNYEFSQIFLRTKRFSQVSQNFMTPDVTQYISTLDYAGLNSYARIRGGVTLALA